MENNVLLKVDNLVVIYKTDDEIVHAVNNLSFVLHRKETMGIVGETGAGKTTLALSILQLLPERTGQITQGDILFDGEELTKYTDADMRAVRGERISMIFQDPMTSLNPVLTVGKQIAESLTLHNSTHRTKEQIEARVDELLELVGIPAQRKNEYPHQFSGGMKQRVVIAIALACDPELLIADEPTTALDVTIQAQVLAMMLKLKRELGTSMIIITHDLGVVAETCDSVAIMYAGEIVEIGAVEDIFEGPCHHPYTAGLFASIPNLDVASDRLSPIEGIMPDPTNLPNGCKFHPRCPYCTDICRSVPPVDTVIHNGHLIRCHEIAQERKVQA